MPNYWVITSSQDWEVPAGLTLIDALIVGGGGASGGGLSGAEVGDPGSGGAGGVREIVGIPVIPGAMMPVVVGAGGLWTNWNASDQSVKTGGSSAFGGFASLGGGGGQTATGGNPNVDLHPASGGGAGASGGGACGGGAGSLPDFRGPGSGTPGQGFPGGAVSVTGTSSLEDRAGAAGGGATQAGAGVSAHPASNIKGGDGIVLADIGWWDQEIAHLLNPDVPELADIDLEGHINPAEWDSLATYPAGSVIWHRAEWRLYVCVADGTTDEPDSLGGTSWKRFYYAVGGGAGGNNWEVSAHNPPGVGGGAEGARGNLAGAATLPAIANSGGGGSAGSLFPGLSYQAPAADGIVILRLGTPALDCEQVSVAEIVYDLATRAGIPASRIDLSGIEPDSEFGMIFGMGAGRPASARQLIELLQNHSFFDMTEQGGIITATRRDRDPVGLIGGNDLRAHAYGETAPTLCERERTEDYEIPREVRVQYTQALAEYEPGVEGYARRVTDAEGVVDIDLSAIAMEPDEAAVIAEASMLEVIVAREQLSFHLVATPENKLLKAGDITTLDVRGLQNVVRITEIGYAFPGILKIQALRHDPTVYSSDAVGVGRRLIGSIITNAGATTYELLDAPLVREFDDVSGYFAALGGNMTIPGILEGWPGGDLQRQEPTGWEDIARVLRPGAVFGTAVNALPDAEYTVITDDELVVTIENGLLESVTLQQMLLGANLAALKVPSGWELIRFTTAVFDDPNWRITGLVRGVNGTEWATDDHAIGDRFVLLIGVEQILTDINLHVNQSWQHNAATIGKLPDPVTEVSFTWTGVDRIPYAPVHIHAERETDDDILIDWTRRDRVGMELQSGQTLPLSEDSEAYEVDIYNGAGDTVLRTLSVTSPEATYTAAQQTTDFGSLPTELDVAVYQIGALGRGYPARTTIEGL